MREPYETLLGQYRDHWLLWPFLQRDVPDFAGIAALEDLLGSVSSSELTMLHVALAFWNGDRTARMADLAGLDEHNLSRVVDAIILGMKQSF